jgi:malate dehydrogenase (oxaloacetate-decarboxylating)(NADP+)
MGVPKSNIFVTDLAGVVYEGRTELMDEDKIQFVQKTSARTLDDVIEGADIFLGLSAGGVLKPAMVKKMAKNPLILALANPTPEILPEEVLAVRTDAIIATGRSDYHNQVNNVLCFPYIFRGALDAGASTITDEMEIASVYAIAELAQAEQSEVVAAAYVGEKLVFGPEYLIPKPFDPRLMMKIAPAVAKAAADSGVARRPIQDMEAYVEKLQSFVYASGSIMKPIYAAAKNGAKKRVCFAEGEEERVLRAVQIVVDEDLAKPTLIGRPAIRRQRLPSGQCRARPSLPRLLANLLANDGAQRRDPTVGQDRYATSPIFDRHHDVAQRRGRWIDLWHLEHTRCAFELC